MAPARPLALSAATLDLTEWPAPKPESFARTLAPLLAATEASSRKRIPAPSLMSEPGLDGSNGLTMFEPIVSSPVAATFPTSSNLTSDEGLTFDSAPPLKHASAAPRSMTRMDSPIERVPLASAHVIVFEGPLASWMMVTWQASMFGRYLRSQSGVRLFIPVSPHCSYENVWLSSPFELASASASSCASAAMRPAPIWQPTRVGSKVIGWSSVAVAFVTMFASAIVLWAAMTAISISRAMTLTALR